jgi:hypothetical protein
VRTSIWRIGCCAALLVVVAASFGYGASWDALELATVSGISLDKPLQAGVLEYTLALDSAPSITIGGNTYAVNWVQAFYVASGTPDGAFIATSGSGPNGWSWDSKSSPAQISGWTAKASSRLNPGDSASFRFGSFDPQGNAVATAFHIGYQGADKQVTGWYKVYRVSNTQGVPEPAGILALCAGLSGLLGLAWRRKAERANTTTIPAG